ncbi:hypothetical protein diail_1102 [Diaporthe ilicicola]|nr:hypothetical protein diail_1102 [Diaporthe ilicicola]
MIQTDYTDQATDEQEFAMSETEYNVANWKIGPAWDPFDETRSFTDWTESEGTPWTDTDTVPSSDSLASSWEYIPIEPSKGPEEVVNDCTALVLANPAPAGSTVQTPAYQRLMYGRLFATREGVIFFPDSAGKEQSRRMVYRYSRIMPTSKNETAEDKNKAKVYMSYLKSGAPRFLFRGFHPMSGGGKDPRLNNTEGIVPHGFLDGKVPTSIWDIPDVEKMASKHMGFSADITSDFSSWSHVLATAEEFAQNDEGSMIAVLDTSSLGDHVWYSEDLYQAGLADHYYTDEYLVYGPVSGRLFHCFPAQMLQNSSRHDELTNGHTFAFGEIPSRILFEQGAIDCARELAGALQPCGTSAESLIVLTAKFLSLRVVRKMFSEDDVVDYENLGLFLYCTRDDIQALSLRADAKDISLVDGTMDTSHTRSLMIEVQLLQATENAVRVLALTVRVAFSRVLAISDRDDLEGAED